MKSSRYRDVTSTPVTVPLMTSTGPVMVASPVSVERARSASCRDGEDGEVDRSIDTVTAGGRGLACFDPLEVAVQLRLALGGEAARAAVADVVHRAAGHACYGQALDDLLGGEPGVRQAQNQGDHMRGQRARPSPRREVIEDRAPQLGGLGDVHDVDVLEFLAVSGPPRLALALEHAAGEPGNVCRLEVRQAPEEGRARRTGRTRLSEHDRRRGGGEVREVDAVPLAGDPLVLVDEPHRQPPHRLRIAWVRSPYRPAAAGSVKYAFWIVTGEYRSYVEDTGTVMTCAAGAPRYAPATPPPANPPMYRPIAACTAATPPERAIMFILSTNPGPTARVHSGRMIASP